MGYIRVRKIFNNLVITKRHIRNDGATSAKCGQQNFIHDSITFPGTGATTIKRNSHLTWALRAGALKAGALKAGALKTEALQAFSKIL